MRSASAVWIGNPETGYGEITSESGALDAAQYCPSSRGDQAKILTPEELIAAAHAGCFAMALCDRLSQAGFYAETITTTATIILDHLMETWTVTDIVLEVVAKVPKAKPADFIDAAVSAKTTCTISRLLNANISMTARLTT